MTLPPIVIACSTDEGYAPGLAVMIRSLLDHYRGQTPLELYVLQTDLLEKTKQRLLSSTKDPRLKIIFLQPDMLPMQGLPCFLNVHPAMYYYLALPKLLSSYGKVLKMDADMLVCGDITALWETDLDNHPMAATRELRSPYVSSDWALPNYQELGIPPMTPYCNAGLQLINLDIWRSEEIAEKIIEHTRKYESVVRCWDQGGVSAVRAGGCLELDPKWNVEAGALILTGWIPEHPAEVHNIVEHAKIIHYIVHKPWKEGCMHPRAALFQRYLKRTAWKSLARDLCPCWLCRMTKVVKSLFPK